MKPATIVVLLVCLLVVAITVSVLRSGPSNTSGTSPEGGSAEPITLRGATQFDESHAFTRTIRRFEQLVREYYDGPVNFELYTNSELGLEKDYFVYMSQGIAVDYGIVSPSHMSTFSNAAPLMDMPFLFRDIDHWNKVLESDAFEPIVEEIRLKADVILVGYAGGGTRNLIVNRPVTNMDDLQGLDLRVMGAPIQTRIFLAVHASPTVIATGLPP